MLHPKAPDVFASAQTSAMSSSNARIAPQHSGKAILRRNAVDPGILTFRKERQEPYA